MHNSAGASANGVGEVSEGCGSEGLKDLGKLVEEKAVLTGAVDGVDEISGDGSGIFVKVRLIYLEKRLNATITAESGVCGSQHFHEVPMSTCCTDMKSHNPFPVHVQ